MSARRKPVKAVGDVNVLAPSAKSPYFRLTWIEPDGRHGGTTGGRTLDQARSKAAEIDAGLQRATGPKALTPLGQVMEEYLASPERRNHKTKKDWSPSHHRQAKQVLRRVLRDHESCPALAVDRTMADVMRAQAGTWRTVDENTSMLRGLLRWGHVYGYFSAGQAEMYPNKCATVAPALKGTSAPDRRRKGRMVVETGEHVRDEDAPSAAQVVAAGEQLAVFFPKYGRLVPEVASSCGPRWGELFQLTAYDIDRSGLKPRLNIYAQIDPAALVRRGDDRRKLPKGEKTRETGIPELTFTGYPLRAQTEKRRIQALAEQAAGLNPDALLFPAAKGGMHHHSSFMSDYFAPAAIAAGWPRQEWVEVCERWDKKQGKFVPVTRERTQFVLSWHSLRHRFARYCIDTLGLTAGELMAVGGWENETVVRNRYYNVGKEHAVSALSKF
jgi:integrase